MNEFRLETAIYFQSSHKETQNYRHENYKDLWLLFVNAQVVIYAAHLLTEHKVPCKYSAISLMGQEPMWFSKNWAHFFLFLSLSCSFSLSLSFWPFVCVSIANEYVCVLSKISSFFFHFLLYPFYFYVTTTFVKPSKRNAPNGTPHNIWDRFSFAFLTEFGFGLQ